MEGVKLRGRFVFTVERRMGVWVHPPYFWGMGGVSQKYGFGT